MAPEQASGEDAIGPPADMFALGAVLFECLAGLPAFARENILAVLSSAKADARHFHEKLGISDPLEKLSIGPPHFAYTGWALLDSAAKALGVDPSTLYRTLGVGRPVHVVPYRSGAAPSVAEGSAMIEGQCHCGAARFTLARPPAQVTDCNCSICVRLGALWAYYPASDVCLSTPKEALGSYRCNDRVLAFRFCATCACTLFWEAVPGEAPAPEGVSPRMGVNARMLVDFDLGAVEVVRFDGASM